MKEVHIKGTDYDISETDLHNQNSVESVIREVSWKWCRTMVKQISPIQIWYYGVSWVSEVMSMARSLCNIGNGGIALKLLTGKAVNISE